MSEIFILLGLVLLNGLFSMAEIALVSARKARLEAQANKGDERAKQALDLSNHPDTFLSTVQIGITLIGILTGLFSGENIKGDIAAFLSRFEWIKPYSNGVATTLVVILVTYLSLVLGELVPKRIGLSRPEAIAKLVAAPMRLISKITHPFIWLLTKSSNIISRIFNIQPNDSQVTEEEIKAIISEGTEHGAIEEAEQEIIERVFHLGDRNITSLMTHRNDIIWIDINATLVSAKHIIRESLHSVYPVCEGNIDNIRGVLFIKDLYLAEDSVTIQNLMKPGVYVPENNSPYQVLERFKETKIHNCFIVDEYGTFLGMITLNDILEAIVGDVPEHGQDEYEIIERKDGSFLADAQLPFYDFLSRFGKTEWMAEGEQEFDTLAGFILHQLERIPQTGDQLEWKGFSFEIVDMDNHRIDKILITVSEEIRGEMED
jgi:putative hemolysin